MPKEFQIPSEFDRTIRGKEKGKFKTTYILTTIIH
jgi:hypothetical protein